MPEHVGPQSAQKRLDWLGHRIPTEDRKRIEAAIAAKVPKLTGIGGWVNEVRDEGDKEGGCLRIERLDDEAFAKGPMRAGRIHFRWLSDARFSPCFEPEPDEIKGSCDLQQCERLGARHHECGDTDRAGKNVHKAAETQTYARCKPFSPAGGKRSRGDIEDARPWSDRHEQSRRQEDEEGLDIRHRSPLDRVNDENNGSALDPEPV
jgi:hypothetical protein